MVYDINLFHINFVKFLILLGNQAGGAVGLTDGEALLLADEEESSEGGLIDALTSGAEDLGNGAANLGNQAGGAVGLTDGEFLMFIQEEEEESSDGGLLGALTSGAEDLGNGAANLGNQAGGAVGLTDGESFYLTDPFLAAEEESSDDGLLGTLTSGAEDLGNGAANLGNNSITSP